MISHEAMSVIDRKAIRLFMESKASFIKGRVLDVGSGRQPYKDIVEGAGGNYYPFDRATFPASTVDADVGEIRSNFFDTVICNQVIQYTKDPVEFVYGLNQYLTSTGILIMTYPTNWNVIEKDDKWRFTRYGMEEIFKSCGFTIIENEVTHYLHETGWPIGGGIVASV